MKIGLEVRDNCIKEVSSSTRKANNVKSSVLNAELSFKPYILEIRTKALLGTSARSSFKAKEAKESSSVHILSSELSMVLCILLRFFKKLYSKVKKS